MARSWCPRRRAGWPPHCPRGLELRDLGERRLKDLASPERLYQLVGEGLAEQVPALANARRAAQQPASADDKLRRSGELARGARRTRRDTRLLTLTGPGGTGKTRLALQLAGRGERRIPRRRLLRCPRRDARRGPRARGIASTLWALTDRRSQPRATPSSTTCARRKVLLRARQLRAGRRGRDGRCTILREAPGRQDHRHHADRAARLRRAGVPRPATRPAVSGGARAERRTGRSVRGGQAVRGARSGRSAGVCADRRERAADRRDLRAPRRVAARHRARRRSHPAADRDSYPRPPRPAPGAPDRRLT